MLFRYPWRLAAFILGVAISLSGCGSPVVTTQRLANGIEMAAIPMKEAPVVTLQAWFHVGSRDERRGWEGASHFLEHLLFKRDVDALGRTLVQRVESLGGIFNAATSHDYTYFYITLAPEHFREGLAVLREALKEPSFSKDAFEKEKQVVLAEIDERRDDPWTRVYHKLWKHVFSGHPYQREVIGTKKSVQALTHLQVGEYYRENYQPDQLTLVLSGPLEKSQFHEGARNAFQDFPQPEMTVVRSSKVLPPLKEDGWEKTTGDVSLEYFALGFQGPPAKSNDLPALELLSVILGGGKSSRLHRQLVEEERIAQSIGATYHAQQDAGLILVYGICAPDKHAALVGRLGGMVKEIRAHAPSGEELERAKTILQADYIRSRETAAGFAQEIGTWSALTKIEDAVDYLSKIQRINPSDIQNVATKYCRFSQGVSLGPNK